MCVRANTNQLLGTWRLSCVCSRLRCCVDIVLCRLVAWASSYTFTQLSINEWYDNSYIGSFGTPNENHICGLPIGNLITRLACAGFANDDGQLTMPALALSDPNNAASMPLYAYTEVVASRGTYAFTCAIVVPVVGGVAQRSQGTMLCSDNTFLMGMASAPTCASSVHLHFNSNPGVMSCLFFFSSSCLLCCSPFVRFDVVWLGVYYALPLLRLSA